MKKTGLAITVLAFSFTAISAMSSFANWHMDNTGYWWENEDGSYAKDQWLWLDGNQDGIAECYYFDENGYMLSDAVAPDGSQVDKDGAWVIDGVKQAKVLDTASGLTSSDVVSDGTAADVSADTAADAAAEGTQEATADDSGSIGSSDTAFQPELPDSSPASGSEGTKEAAVYSLGSLNVRADGIFAGAKASSSDNELNLVSSDLKYAAVIMRIDLAQDPDYQSVMQSAQALGIDLNSDAMKSLVMDTIESSFTASMGVSPSAKADKTFPTGVWRQFRYDPDSVGGTYTDVLIRYDSNVFYAIVIGAEGGYADVDAFMNNSVY